jgi:hypothetical protein
MVFVLDIVLWFTAFTMVFVLDILLWFTAFTMVFVLDILLWFTASHYPFGIFKLFFHNVIQMVQGKAGTFYLCIWDNSHQNNMRKSSQKRYIIGYKDKFVVCKWVNFHIYHSERLLFREMIARLVLGLQTELEF